MCSRRNRSPEVVEHQGSLFENVALQLNPESREWTRQEESRSERENRIWEDKNKTKTNKSEMLLYSKKTNDLQGKCSKMALVTNSGDRSGRALWALCKCEYYSVGHQWKALNTGKVSSHLSYKRTDLPFELRTDWKMCLSEANPGESLPLFLGISCAEHLI